MLDEALEPVAIGDDGLEREEPVRPGREHRDCPRDENEEGHITRPGARLLPVLRLDREERLLSEQAFKDVERSEEQYTRAIDDLSRLVAPKLDMPESALLIALRERLQTIDVAIAESRAQIEQNPFNAQLRRQLLYIYQEKRRTLEQIQDHDDTTL